MKHLIQIILMLAAIAAKLVVAEQTDKDPPNDNQPLTFVERKIYDLEASFTEPVPWEFFSAPMSEKDRQTTVDLLELRDLTLKTHDELQDPILWIATWCYECIPWATSRGPICWAALWCYGCAYPDKIENPQLLVCSESKWRMCASKEVSCNELAQPWNS